MRRIAGLLVLAVLTRAGTPQAGESRKLVPQKALGRATRVEACTSPNACSEWVRYPATPPREVVETAFSRSRSHFFVWSKAEGEARTLDIFVTPTGPAGSAKRTAHLAPGFGGELHWVADERLWHAWGCGTACVGARLYDPDGKVRYAENGSWQEVAPDKRRIAILDIGSVVLIDAVTLERYASAPIPGVGYPEKLAWTANGVIATFSAGEGEPKVLVCAPAATRTLDCRNRPRARVTASRA